MLWFFEIVVALIDRWLYGDDRAGPEPSRG